MTTLQNKLPRSGDLAVNEDLYFAACHQMAEQLVAIRKEGTWKLDHNEFHDYTKKRLGLSKTRTNLLLHFAHFAEMCRQHRMRMPDSPECVQRILSLPRKRWLDTWEVCVVHARGKSITPGHVEATMQQFFGLESRKKPPQAALDNMAAKRAEKALAGISDVENVKRTGRDWDKAIHTAIEIDQRRMERR